MNFSKALWTLGTVIGVQQAAKAMRDVEWNDVLGVIGLERRPSAIARALPALGLVAVSAAIGAGAALLLAPSSGEELRARLSNGLDDMKSNMKNRLEDVKGRVSDKISQIEQQQQHASNSTS
jgi:YtxH-like protein